LICLQQELAEIAVGQIPEHWHLWQQYSTGVILSETGEKTADVEKLKETAAKHTKQMKVSSARRVATLAFISRGICPLRFSQGT